MLTAVAHVGNYNYAARAFPGSCSAVFETSMNAEVHSGSAVRLTVRAAAGLTLSSPHLPPACSFPGVKEQDKPVKPEKQEKQSGAGGKPAGQADEHTTTTAGA